MSADFYEVLGVPRNAAQKDIQSAYRRLARRYHPDVAGDDTESEDRFKQINAAHDVLGDDKKRAAYDKWGERWEHAEQLEEMERNGAFGFQPGSQQPGGGFGPFGSFGQHGGQPGGARFSFSGGGADLGDLFEGLFSNRAPAAPPTRDVEHPVTVSLREAFSGTTRTIQTPRVSPDADGPRFSRIEVKIPPGVANGSRVKVKGKGGGAPGGPSGDLYLVITVEEDPRFERKGDDLYTDVPVPVATAALGGEVTVPTITGRVALRIPQGAQNGRVFRLAGQGMPRLQGRKGGKRGDLLARVRLQLPEPLTPEQLALFRQLRDLEQPAPPDGSDA